MDDKEDEKNAKERFMEAAGAKVPKAPQRELTPETMQKHLEQMQRTVETVLNDVQMASAAANASKGNIKRLYEFLNEYCQVTMPEQMRKALEKVSGQVFQDTVRPLDDEVRKTASEVESLGWALNKLTWFWVRDIALAGVVMGRVGALMVRCTVNQKIEEMDLAKRYELWGRSVEQKIAQLPPAKQKKFRAWLGHPHDAVER